MSVFCASGIGPFGCKSKDLMVLVPLKKTNFVFYKVCLYCLLRPLMYGMTTLAPSIKFTMDGFGFLLGFAFFERTVLSSGCLLGLCESNPFPLQGIQV